MQKMRKQAGEKQSGGRISGEKNKLRVWMKDRGRITKKNMDTLRFQFLRNRISSAEK